MRHAAKASLALLFASCLDWPAAAAVVPDPLRPPTTGGLESIDRNLAKLETHARLLVIGAHPDDEDTSLLALVARGMHGEAAYLSLSRGEGGQNLIGPELGVPLGLLRTQELLAARRLDGGRQFFARAYDFGYTASLDETFRRWPKAALLEDVVRVIRRFRPQVVVSVFPNDGGGGHGQHQAAGVVAHEAFALAGDRNAVTALGAEGLAPWAPESLFRATWFDRTQTTLVLSTGTVEPFSGRSIYQLAMASRSQHRSQDMGRLQEVGPKETRLGWVSGGVGPGGALLFSGVDTRLRAIALLLPAGAARDVLWAGLTRVEESARAARSKMGLGGGDGGALAAAVRETLLRLRAATAKVTDPAVRALLDEKTEAATEAWLGARGVVLDATADRETVAPGERLPVVLTLWNSGREPLHVTGLGLVSLDGWTAGEVSPPFAAQDLPPGGLLQWTVEATAPADAATTPYFLRRPLRGDVYDWSAADAAIWGQAFEGPPLAARVTLEEAGEPVVAARAAVHRHNEQAAGEVRRPLRAAPALEVAVEPALMVTSTAAGQTPAPRTFEVFLVSHSTRPLAGQVEWEVPAGWPPLPPARWWSCAGRRRRGSRPGASRCARAPSSTVDRWMEACRWWTIRTFRRRPIRAPPK
jgi:LmbE family N-acetylglucosaminyl deacetylase